MWKIIRKIQCFFTGHLVAENEHAYGFKVYCLRCDHVIKQKHCTAFGEVIRFLIMAAILLILPQYAFASDWKKEDTLHEAVYLTLTLADLQSSWSVTSKDSPTYEVNPVMGRHPTPIRLVSTMAATAVVHYLIARSIPEDWRNTWYDTTINLRWSMVENNYDIDSGRAGGWIIAYTKEF